MRILRLDGEWAKEEYSFLTGPEDEDSPFRRRMVKEKNFF